MVANISSLVDRSLMRRLAWAFIPSSTAMEWVGPEVGDEPRRRACALRPSMEERA